MRQQQALAAAARELANSQAELDRTLEERRASLQALLTSVESRRLDLDEVMQAFAKAIEDSFERVESRAREMGAFLAEASQETSGMVERQFGEIRAVMGDERAHTASLLRAAYEQANSEIDSIFAQSTDRFQSAAAEMRSLAREIQRELETTREELHRNAISLPQETAEQAAVMRRVVADQIKALNELTDVVARSGRNYDLAEPSSARVVDAVPAGRRIEPLRYSATWRRLKARVRGCRPGAALCIRCRAQWRGLAFRSPGARLARRDIAAPERGAARSASRRTAGDDLA